MSKSFSMVLGIVLLAAGVIGWLSGGHDHNLIIFGINMKHNLVHVLSGALAILASFAGTKFAKLYCLVFGSVYALVTVAGFLNIAPIAQQLNLNTADNFLHLTIAGSCLFVAVTGKSA